MNRYVAAMLIAIVAGQALVARAGEPALDSLKRTYEAQIEKIQDAHNAKLSKLLDTYGSSLGRSVETLKRKGDPDAVLQALTEKRRFEQERTVPGEPNDALPPLMQDVQSSYLKAVAKVDAEKAKAIANLIPGYVAALERLMKALTAQEKLDLALNVKEEKQRVESILAEAEPAPPRTPVQEPPRARKAGQNMTVDLGDGTGMTFVWIPAGTLSIEAAASGSMLHDAAPPNAPGLTTRTPTWASASYGRRNPRLTGSSSQNARRTMERAYPPARLTSTDRTTD